MYRAKGALFRTIETVVDENPLAFATSRIVAVGPLALDRFTNGSHAEMALPNARLSRSISYSLELERSMADTTAE